MKDPIETGCWPTHGIPIRIGKAPKKGKKRKVHTGYDYGLKWRLKDGCWVVSGKGIRASVRGGHRRDR